MTRYAPYAVAALLALHALLAATSVLHKSPTFDETVHIAGGLSYWKWRDYRLQPENGVLPQRLAALPLLAGDVAMPSRDDNAWRTSHVYSFADDLFYNLGNDARAMLFRSRCVFVALSCVLGLAIFFWSRSLFGAAGGLLSLAAYAISPTMLAHGRLATSDVCAALFFLLAVWSLWRVMRKPTWRAALLAGAAVGLALVSKFSTVLLAPIGVVMLIVRLLRDRRDGARLAGCAAMVVVVSAAVVWGCYGFRFAAMTGPGEFVTPWHVLEKQSGIIMPVVATARQWKLLPEGYLYGFAYMLSRSDQRYAFMAGRYSLGGWATFFPYAFIVKTSLVTLALAGLTLAMSVTRWRRARVYVFALTPLLVLLIVYWTVAVSSNLNIGHRHLLPTYPAMFVMIGFLGRVAKRVRPLRIALVWLIALGAVQAAAVHPHYLAFFNTGMDGGYRKLVDSSLDWGQDLPALKRYLGALPDDERKYLVYFGAGSPTYYGIDAKLLTSYWNAGPLDVPRSLRGGTYCVSATMLQSLYVQPAGRWCDVYEKQYQVLRERIITFATSANREELLAEHSEAQWLRQFFLFEQYRFARLAAYLRQREPDAGAGHSILIYRLTDAEAHEAEAGPPAELHDTSGITSR